MAETYLLVMRCPVYRRRDSNLGFHTELENLVGDAKRKLRNNMDNRLKDHARRRGEIV